jgi:ferredoxin
LQGGASKYEIDHGYCEGWGNCAAVCPCGAIEMPENDLRRWYGGGGIRTHEALRLNGFQGGGF